MESVSNFKTQEFWNFNPATISQPVVTNSDLNKRVMWASLTALACFAAVYSVLTMGSGLYPLLKLVAVASAAIGGYLSFAELQSTHRKIESIRQLELLKAQDPDCDKPLQEAFRDAFKIKGDTGADMSCLPIDPSQIYNEVLLEAAHNKDLKPHYRYIACVTSHFVGQVRSTTSPVDGLGDKEREAKLNAFSPAMLFVILTGNTSDISNRLDTLYHSEEAGKNYKIRAVRLGPDLSHQLYGHLFSRSI